MLTWQRKNAENPWRRNWTTERREETRQEFATNRIQFYQHATVADGGDKARQFQMLLNSFREWGELYDRGHRLRDSMDGAA